MHHEESIFYGLSKIHKSKNIESILQTVKSLSFLN